MSKTSAENVKKSLVSYDIYYSVNYWPKMGHGNYGIIVLNMQDRSTFTGGLHETTANRMHLRAAIEALAVIPAGSVAVLHTNSKYVIDGLRRNWVKGWCKRGWKRTDGTMVPNHDLWMMLHDLAKDRHLERVLIPNHVDNEHMKKSRALAQGAKATTPPFDQ